MLLLETLGSCSTTKISRHIRPYRHLIFGLVGLSIVVVVWLHLASLRNEILTKLEESQETIDEVDLDSSLYEDGNKKGVDIDLRRNPNPKKGVDVFKKGGFAPMKKLVLATDFPAVEIPPFFPKIDFNCKPWIKRVAGAWVTHLKDPGDAQHRHRTDSWNLCFHDQLSRLNMFAPRGTGTSCVVYSFGMDTNWSFEEDMLLHNCAVHMFDGSKEQHSKIIRRKVRNLTIHRAILSERNIKNHDDMKEEAGEQEGIQPDERTLSSIMDDLEHKRVDVLKVDIEGAELLALESASKTLTAGVDQILLEVHMHISDHAHDSAHPEHFDQATVDKWSKLFTSLYNDGYRTYDIRAKGTDREGNIIPRHQYSCCYRIAMIRTPYQRKSQDSLQGLDFES